MPLLIMQVGATTKMYIYSIIALLTLYSVQIFAQDISFKHLTTDDGLSNNQVLDLIQDKSGFIWMATDDGLNRFDGYSFKVYRNIPGDSTSLSDNSVWTLFEDRNGFIWIGTKSGDLNRYNPQTDEFTNWKIKSEFVEESSITAIYEDRSGAIWIGTYKSGVYRFEPKTGTTEEWNNNSSSPSTITNNFITSILEDNDGNILIGTYLGLNIFNYEKSKSKFTHIYSDRNNPNSLSNNLIWSLTKSGNDSNLIWIGTADGLTDYRSDKKTFFRIQIPNPESIQFGTGAGNVIEEINHGEKILWVDSYAGLLKLNTSNGYFVRYLANQSKTDYLISNQINKIIRDRSGVTWIATENGISFFTLKGSKFNKAYSGINNPFGLTELNGKNITAIFQTSDKTIWYGTSDGLYYSEKKEDKISLRKHSGFNDVNIWSLCEDRLGNLWIGTYGKGLYLLNLKTNSVNKKDLIDSQLRTQSVNFIKSLFVDDDNNLWIGFWGLGLARLNLVKDEIKVWLSNADTNKNSISHNDVWSIFQDSKKRLWIGTNGGGLNLFVQSEEGKFLRWLSDTNEPNSLSSNSINAIIESSANANKDKTVLWLGTMRGLNKIVINSTADVKDGELFKLDVTIYTVEDGIADNSVNSILEDESGNIWLGTGSGINYFDVEKQKFTNFTKADGIIGGHFNTFSACREVNGVLLFGSTAGLNYFVPEEIFLSNYIPPVVLTDFQIFNKSVNRENNPSFISSITQITEIPVSYDENVFSFEFAALDYNSPQSIQYAYMMEGFDKEWIYSGSRRLATYTNLDPGEYTFKVKATNADGVWNENAKSILIIITPPFWMTWWFRSILIFAFLSLGPIIYYRRVSQLKKEKQIQIEFSGQLIQSQEYERKRIASELHDSLGQDLLVIKNLALLNKNKDDQFEEISKTASGALDEVRRISYNLHPYQLDRLGLSRAISSMFGNIEGASKIKFDLQVDNIDNLLSKDKEINIFRIVQECVNNILKHSGASVATVTVQHIENQIKIEIADDGKGFDFESAKEQSRGLGLKNLINRVSLLNGKIDYSSTSEFATFIKIQIPVNNEQ
ncbi:MAG TPA: two-component regulator propeller domain-containing protein [Ignavibacteriaceae bacterium]|nr:two-component regulator propeller domain-containing protein [Ignavibacteriaceae bacterium]